MSKNSLQAVLDRVKTEPVKKKETNTIKIEKEKITKNISNTSLDTIMIGARFSREVGRQLRILAAEEGTTNQALIGEALELLFTKKGKRIVIDE